MSGQPLHIGRNSRTGRRMFIHDQQRLEHMFVPGTTGSGKTTALEYYIRQDIKNGNGLCLLDPDGGLYREALRYCAKRRGVWDKVILLDPGEDLYRFGLNYFDIPGYETDKIVDLVIKAGYRATGQAQQEIKVLWERWGAACLEALATYPVTPLTLAELHGFAGHDAFRGAVLELLPATYDTEHMLGEWDHFDTALTKPEKNTALFAVLNRASLFSRNARLREIVGQPSTVDWRRAMDEGHIVLVNLAERPGMNEDVTRMLGIMIIHQLVSAAKLRPDKPRPKPFYVYVDEFSTFVAEASDFITSLNRLRKRGVGFILALQNLAQLVIQGDRTLYDTILGCTNTQLVFRMPNAEEARVLADQLFGKDLTGTMVKYQPDDQTQALPVSKSEDVEKVSHTFGGSRSGATLDSTSETKAYDPNNDELITTRGLNFGSQAAWQEMDATQVSTERQRWTEYEYLQIRQTPVFRSPEEELNYYRRRIFRQDTGEAQLQYDPKKPTASVNIDERGASREFPELDTTDAEVAELSRHVYSRMNLRTVDDVRALTSTRRGRVIGAMREHQLELEAQRQAAASLEAPDAPVWEEAPKLAPKAGARKKPRNKATKQGPDLTAPA